MVRLALCRQTVSRRERAAIARRRVEERDGRLGPWRRPAHECRPDDLDDVLAIDRYRRAILRTAVEHPPILADARGSRECAPSVSRQAEGDVANVARIHMTPRGVQRTVGTRGERGLAAVADAAGQRDRRNRSIQPREIQLRELQLRHDVCLLWRTGVRMLPFVLHWLGVTVLDRFPMVGPP